MKSQASASSSSEQMNPDIILQSSTKEVFFSFHTAMNLYKAYTYSFGGPAHAGIVAVISVADGMLSSSNLTERNYFSISSFWGSTDKRIRRC